MIADHPIEAAYFAAVIACAVVLVLRFSVGRIRHKRQRQQLDREPRCATCGYIVATCTSPICPECGRDLREFGLITARACPQVGLIPLYVLMALVAWPIAIPTGMFVAHRQPLFGWRYHYEEMVSLSYSNGVLSGPRYAVQSEGSGRFFSRHHDYLWVYCNTGGKVQSMLVVDLHTNELAVVDVAGKKSAAQPINCAQICQFLRLRSTNDADAELTRASERIMSSILAQAVGNISSEELTSIDPLNGVSLSYSVTGAVAMAIILFTWGCLSLLSFAAISEWTRRSLRKRRRLWRAEVDRLGLAR